MLDHPVARDARRRWASPLALAERRIASLYAELDRVTTQRDDARDLARAHQQDAWNAWAKVHDLRGWAGSLDFIADHIEHDHRTDAMALHGIARRMRK